MSVPINLFFKASQAIKKNHTILVTSGSGMAADSGIPTFRGTQGLWKHYPAFKEQKILFDDFVDEKFFLDHPEKYWYVYGDLYNKMAKARPHEGYYDLLEILETVKSDGNWFLYHSGIDNLYQKAGFPKDKIMQGKGNIFYWQCKPCNFLMKHDRYRFMLNHTKGEVKMFPRCKKCRRPVRANVNMRNDFDWIETVAEQQQKNYEKWELQNENRSKTVIEIGAGSAQPLARGVGEQFLKNDKYRTALVRINPIKERESQYQWERQQFFKLVGQEEIGEVPDYLNTDYKHIVKEEEEQYNALRNQLIELQINAEQGLSQLKKTILS